MITCHFQVSITWFRIWAQYSLFYFYWTEKDWIMKIVRENMEQIGNDIVKMSNTE